MPGDRCFPTLVVRTVAGEAAMNSEALRKPDDVKLEVDVQIKINVCLTRECSCECVLCRGILHRTCKVCYISKYCNSTGNNDNVRKRNVQDDLAKNVMM